MRKTLFSMFLLSIVLVLSASALEIDSPASAAYNTTDITLSITHNETLDNITYSIDNGSEVLACTNCSDFDANLMLLEGNHTIDADGTLGNESFSDSVSFSIVLPVILAEPSFAVNITSPESITYNVTDIPLNILTNVTVDKIEYRIDDGNISLGCENCSAYNNTINLTEGNHTITASGTIGNTTVTDEVFFSIVIVPANETNETPASFTLTITEPQSKTYNTSSIPIKVEANTTLDSISYKIDDNFELACENCSTYNDTLNLSDDDYTITFQGVLGNLTINESVSFSVDTEVTEDNETDDNETEEPEEKNETAPRFDLGFEKLPQAVENGELTDSELAEIIRSNKLNPGVLNRLIKTGKLGNESIDAIIDTQKQPPGIFRKLMLFFGFKPNTVATQIYEEYNLTVKQEDKLTKRDDLPRGYEKKIKEKKAKKVNIQDKDKSSTVSGGQGKNAASSQSNVNIVNKTPPGLQKNNKIPPGQLKKNNKSQKNR